MNSELLIPLLQARMVTHTFSRIFSLFLTFDKQEDSLELMLYAFLLERRLPDISFWLQLHKVTWRRPCGYNALSAPCLSFSLRLFIYSLWPTLIKSDLLSTFLLHFSIINRSYIYCTWKHILYLIKSFLWWLFFEVTIHWWQTGSS